MTELLGIAKRPVVSVHPEATVREVARLMAETGVGVVVVVDGYLRGIISERDVVTRVIAEGRDPAQTAVRTVMTSAVRTVRPNVSADEVVALAHEGRFKQIPVVDAMGEVIGMLPVRELLCFYADELDVKTSELLTYLSADGPGG